MSHVSSSSIHGLEAMGLIGLVLLLVSPWGPCERNDAPTSSPAPLADSDPVDGGEPVTDDIGMNDRITPADVDFAHTVYGEGCWHQSCAVYIASPPGPESELYDSSARPFVRLRTPKGDDLSFHVYEGPFFEALTNLRCYQNSSECVAATHNVLNAGQYWLVFYDAPRGTHTYSVSLSDLRFTVQHDPLLEDPIRGDKEVP
jgi:hypothetical protein